jgi:hypothetical protein
MKIPAPYRAILEKLNGVFRDPIIEVREFRKTIATTFRCNHLLINKIIREMKELGLIKYESSNLIRILKKIN